MRSEIRTLDKTQRWSYSTFSSTLNLHRCFLLLVAVPELTARRSATGFDLI